jgi:hypothetical protein
MIKGLDMDLLRKEREKLAAQAPPPEPKSLTQETSTIHAEVETDLGKRIRNILFNPNIPYPHMVGYEDRLDSIVNGINELPPGMTIPEPSTLFRNGRSQYVFSMDESMALPLLVVKSVEPTMRPTYAARTSPEMISAIHESLKKSKKKKKEKKNFENETTETAELPNIVAVDDDLDMFGDFSSAPVLREKVNIKGPIFASSDEREIRSEDIEAIRNRLVEASHTREQARAEFSRASEKQFSVSGDDDFGQVMVEFGEKLTADQFIVSRSEDSGKQKRKGRNHEDTEILKKLKDKK